MRSLFAMAAIFVLAFSLAGCGQTATTEKKPAAPVEQTIKITGAGSVYPALELVSNAYQAKVRGVKVVYLPNNQTTGGITGVREGLVEVGSVTRPLKPAESAGQMEYRELARDALVVATHPSVAGVTNLTTEQIKAIYSGAVRNWREVGGPDASIVVLDRPEDESAKVLLRQFYLGSGLKIVSSAVMLQQESELIDALRDTPSSIGAFSLAYAIANKLAVNRLSLDGVPATPEEVVAGRYKMVRTLGVVWKNAPTPATKEFLDFALGKAGAQELSTSGYVPSYKSE